MTDRGNTGVVGCSDRVTLGLMNHCPELANLERLSVLTYTCLHEEHGSFGVDFDKDGNDEEGYEKHNESNQCHDAVEAPLEKKTYGMLISLHVAWSPC